MIDRLIANVLEWAAGHHDEGRFSPVAIVFHWTMAGLVSFQLFWGWWMGQLPVGGDKVAAQSLHYAIGVLMLVLAMGRGAWRLLAPGPINDADKPGWESHASTVTHYLFYICLFGLPLSGWAIVSATAREQDLTLLGLTSWPLMPFQDLSAVSRWRMEAITEWMHWALVVTLLLLIPIHIGAALKHQIIDRDDVLHGMLPVVPQPKPRRTRWQRRYRAVEQRVRALARRRFGLSRRR
ncbi:cytochrome b [Brevundimonas sp. Root1279]|uniref:cytochrome b n=1 Tax=Brevundimonas sp. Root1279 TaxID=1736443 RepID=UPI0007007731|nr:cytochrome b [Brevundimonas sp. Root1279]KQW79808.1 cytochrome B [Brevundimonas sp. Root1279]